MYFFFFFSSIISQPDSLYLEYHYSYGSVPPPYHYEYDLIIQNSVATLQFYPNYPSYDSTFWKYEFQLSKKQLDTLYQLIRKATLRVEMKHRTNLSEEMDFQVGGPTEFCRIEIPSQGVFLIKDEDRELEEVKALYQFLNKVLIPEEVWLEIKEKHEKYIDEHKK